MLPAAARAPGWALAAVGAVVVLARGRLGSAPQVVAWRGSHLRAGASPRRSIPGSRLSSRLLSRSRSSVLLRALSSEAIRVVPGRASLAGPSDIDSSSPLRARSRGAPTKQLCTPFLLPGELLGTLFRALCPYSTPARVFSFLRLRFRGHSRTRTNTRLLLVTYLPSSSASRVSLCCWCQESGIPAFTPGRLSSEVPLWLPGLREFVGQQSGAASVG